MKSQLFLERAQVYLSESKENILIKLSSMDRKTVLSVAAVAVAAFALIGVAAYLKNRGTQIKTPDAKKTPETPETPEAPEPSFQLALSEYFNMTGRDIDTLPVVDDLNLPDLPKVGVFVNGVNKEIFLNTRHGMKFIYVENRLLQLLHQKKGANEVVILNKAEQKKLQFWMIDHMPTGK